MADFPTLIIHTDGASRGNPGDAAYAFVIARDGLPAFEEAGCLGQMTNNQAEYTALVRALERGLELGSEANVLLHSDSELLVKQMKGEYRVKNEELRGLYQQAQGFARRFAGKVTFKHVRRAQNSRADALCNEVLDGTWEGSASAAYTGGSPPTGGQTAATSTPLRDEMLAALEKAAAAWRTGNASPSIEGVCDEMLALLSRRGIDTGK